MTSKNIKKRVNILMCATLLSTLALPVTPVFADEVSSVIEKTTSDKPANGVSDQAQQNESAISSTKIEETTMSSTSALPVTPVFADDVSSVIEKTTSDKPANGVSDQAQQNESAISSTKIEETTMSSTATVSKENSHLEVQKKSSSSESSDPATSDIATDEAVQPTNIITDMWGTAPVSYNKVNGELTVSSGTIDNNIIGSDIGNSSIKKQDITKIIISGDVKLPSNSEYLFSGGFFPNLVVIEGSFDTSNVTDMSNMFFNSKLTSLDVSQWNTSNVTDMSQMFETSELTSLDVSQWNTSNVTDMSYMFEWSELTSLDVSQWNTSNVTDMSHMFHNSKLTSLDVSQWNTSNVTDMNYMFSTSKLTSLDVSQWNTSNVTDMSDMFNVTNLTELDLTNWDTSKVKSFSRMLSSDGIEKLTLGSKTKLNSDAWLPDILPYSGGVYYTGRWERIDPVSPQSFYNDSDAFMSNYDGSFPGTYVWEKTKVKAADVTAKYLDESGKTISDNVILSGNIGEDYNTTQKDLPGYTFKAVQGNPTGQFTSDAQIVTYIYTKDPVAGANVTAKYVDENGKTISDNVVKSGNIGDDYSTEQKAIPGYTFKEIQGSASGQFTDKEQTITYVYTKNAPTITTDLKHQLTPGNPSQPSNATNNGVINTSTNTGSKVNNGAVNSPELPQTGENNSQSQTMSFIGILLAMFGSLLGFLGIKKRRND